MSSTKPQAIHVDHLEWVKPEDSPNPEALAATANGYRMELAPSTESKSKWDWSCHRGSVLIGSGTSRSRHGAIWGCGLAANRDQKLRAKARVIEEQPKEPEQPEEPEGPNGNEMLAAVEQDVQKAVDKPKRQRKAQTAA